MSEWKKIWNSKGITDNHIDLTLTSTEEGFSKLKELMGITVFKGNGVTFEDFSNQFKQNLREMMFSRDGQKQVTSFFEVGCGTGSYLWLINRWFADSPTKIVVGGGDYSDAFVEIAKQVVESDELYSGEAIDLDTTKKYDIVFSRSVFQYFDDENYAAEVAKKMICKAKHSIAILDVHDLRLREEFLNYRRSVIVDYDVKYAMTKHLFLPKSFFISIAEENNCDVKFSDSSLPGYWNDKFTYDVYFWHR